MILGKKHIHFIGVGGAGMYPLAEFMISHGQKVTGSDRNESTYTDQLTHLGATIQFNHDPLYVKDADLVVYTSAVNETNKELQYAQQNGIQAIKRAEILGDLMRSRYSIAIAGTHGKTTTTSMVGTIFQQSGLDPTVLVGGTLVSQKSNAIIGKSNILIAEADEYDRSFLKMYPSIALVNNVESEHLDIYRDLDDIKESFKTFVKRVPFYGFIAVCNDNEVAKEVCEGLSQQVITFGVSEKSNYQAVNVKTSCSSTSFTVQYNGLKLGEVTIPVPGIYNVRNALGAILIAHQCGIEFNLIARSFDKYKGVKRRFELRGTVKGIDIIDDYAHHPSEVKAALEAALSRYKHVVAVLQPHLYTRTRDFMSDFAEALSRAHTAVVTSIFKAREEPIEGVSSEDIASLVKDTYKTECHYVETLEDACDTIAPLVREEGCVLLMGAGNIGTIAEELERKIGSIY